MKENVQRKEGKRNKKEEPKGTNDRTLGFDYPRTKPMTIRHRFLQLHTIDLELSKARKGCFNSTFSTNPKEIDTHKNEKAMQTPQFSQDKRLNSKEFNLALRQCV